MAVQVITIGRQCGSGGTQKVYLKTMKEALQDNLRYAVCSLYNVKLPVRITSRCVANAEGTGYMHCV